MEAIDLSILYEETDELPTGLCCGCGIPIEYDAETAIEGQAGYCRACEESDVYPA
ncbi:MAG TPA: hypothetical protein VGK27_01570 [Candidatus Deferrimicrobiaceae bacterium]|jgi:hypothetical protein